MYIYVLLRNEGQFTALNDCTYRSMFNHKYTALVVRLIHVYLHIKQFVIARCKNMYKDFGNSIRKKITLWSSYSHQPYRAGCWVFVPLNSGESVDSHFRSNLAGNLNSTNKRSGCYLSPGIHPNCAVEVILCKWTIICTMNIVVTFKTHKEMSIHLFCTIHHTIFSIYSYELIHFWLKQIGSLHA